MNRLEIVTLGDTPMPAYATLGSAGFDLTNQTGDDIVIGPGSMVMIKTGLKMKIPMGFVGMLTPRSGTSFNSVGFSIANSPGVIDEDYPKEVGILACNYGNNPITISVGERIAQLVVVPYLRCELVKVDELTPYEGSTRTDGFGHTGTH